MAYYYVKSGGTATGTVSYSTKNTGSFANALTNDWGSKGLGSAEAYYYNDLMALIAAVTFNDGDIVYASDVSDYEYSVTTNIVFTASVECFSVDDSNVDQYKSGFRETTTASFVINYRTSTTNTLSTHGFTLFSLREMSFGSGETKNTLSDCVLESSLLSSRSISGINDGNWFEFNDCTIKQTTTNEPFFLLYYGTVWHFKNLKADAGNPARSSGLFSFNGLGGSTLIVEDTDFTALTTGAIIVGSLASNDDTVKITLKRCKIASSNLPTNTANNTFIFDFVSCDIGDGYHFFHNETPTGIASENTSIYLNDTYDGTNGYSTEMNANANTSIGNPLRHKLAELPAQDLTSNATYKVNFVTTDATTAATLTDTEFWIEVERNDADDNALGVTQSSRNTDILATGTTHTTNTESWTGLSADSNKYEDSLTVTGMTGITNGTVTVYAVLAKPTTDVYVCPALDVT